MSNRLAMTAPPRLRDASSLYARAADRLQELEAELARLEDYDPKHPDLFLREFNASDIDKMEPLRRARIARLRGSAAAERRDGLIWQARNEADRLRAEASRLVCRAARPAYDERVSAIAAAARVMLAAIEAHDEFLQPLERDGVAIGALVSRGAPSGEMVRQLRQFLRNQTREVTP